MPLLERGGEGLLHVLHIKQGLQGELARSAVRLTHLGRRGINLSIKYLRDEMSAENRAKKNSWT